MPRKHYGLVRTFTGKCDARGDYLAMNCSDIKAYKSGVLVGNYPFDGVRNIEITNSRLISKDCFWNCENVTVRDSFISGEYLAWNSRNVTFENCTIESLQGLCYVDNLVLRNCRLINTTLVFRIFECGCRYSQHYR